MISDDCGLPAAHPGASRALSVRNFAACWPAVNRGRKPRKTFPGKPRPRLILQGLEETAAYQDETGKRYTGFMRQTLGLPLSGDYGQVPAKLWYLHKV